jgi:hypothetical protein
VAIWRQRSEDHQNYDMPRMWHQFTSPNPCVEIVTTF